jgi:hypothetical protein
MTQGSTASESSLTGILSKVAGGERPSKINVSLTDGNRISFANWGLAEDCLIERWQDGRPRYVVPMAQIVIIELPDGE